MKNQNNNSTISRFLFKDEFHVHRHLLLLLIILIISTDVFFDAPDKLSSSGNLFYGWLGYFLFLNLIIYINIKILTPLFLIRNKPFLYLISIILLVITSMALMIILQSFFYESSILHQEPSYIALSLNMAASFLSIGFIVIGTSSLLLFKDWANTSQHISELKSATLQSELKFLKDQINPHFLFNMLNNAAIMIEEDPDTASSILTKLNDLLRYQINDTARDKVSLKADINFLIDFLDLEKTRRDQFDYTISREENIHDVNISPLLFIPFVENAIKHSSDSKNFSYVNISFRINNNKLQFICENSKPLKAIKQKEGGLGLVNIKRRLDLLYTDNYTLEQKETNTIYTVHLILNL